jgi:hypothetical protein
MPSESSIAHYTRVIATLAKRGATDLKDVAKVLRTAQTTIKGEDAKPSYTSNILTAVMHFTKDMPEYERYKAEMVKYMLKHSGLKTGGITEKSVGWKELSAVYKDYEGQDRAVLAVYSLAPPRRLHDYASMVVVARKPKTIDGNYLVINKSSFKFIFSDYKTSAKYGIQEFKVPPALREELEPIAVVGHPLFRTSTGAGYADTTFSTLIGDLTFAKLGKRATPNTFRHSYISELDATAPTPAKRKQIAEFMAHSVGMSFGYVERDGDE